MSNVFDAANPNPEGSIAAPDQQIAELNKKIEELTKARANGDALIEHLKSQNKELTEDLTKRVDPSDILEEIKKLQTNKPEGGGATVQATDPEEVKSLVEDIITRRAAKEKAEANMQTVSDEVKKQFGDKAKEFVANKATELGLSMEDMMTMASRSPEAFFRSVGMKVDAKQVSPSVHQSSINPEALGGRNVVEGTFAWYQEMRKKNPTLYHSAKVQKQMFEHRKKLGEDFYK